MTPHPDDMSASALVHRHWSVAAIVGWGFAILLLIIACWLLSFLHFTVEFSGRFAFHEPATMVSRPVSELTTTSEEAEGSKAGITVDSDDKVVKDLVEGAACISPNGRVEACRAEYFHEKSKLYKKAPVVTSTPPLGAVTSAPGEHQ